MTHISSLPTPNTVSAGISPAGNPPASAATQNHADIPAPARVFADPMNAALAAIAEFARESKVARRQMRQQKEAALHRTQEKQIDAMKKRARVMKIGAAASGSMLMMSGVAHGMRARAAGKAIGATDAKCRSELKESQKRWSSVATLSQESHKLVDASVGARNATFEAAEKASELSASRQTSEINDYRDYEKQDAEFARKAADTIRSLLELRHSALSALANQRG